MYLGIENFNSRKQCLVRLQYIYMDVINVSLEFLWVLSMSETFNAIIKKKSVVTIKTTLLYYTYLN